MSKAHEIVRTGLTFAEFFRRFPDDTTAEAWFESRRWPNGPVCPHCDGARVTAVASRRPMPYRCKDCRNRRGVHVLDRMGEAATSMDGRRLTYRELTGSRG